jgi:hypothetical protein
MEDLDPATVTDIREFAKLNRANGRGQHVRLLGVLCVSATPKAFANSSPGQRPAIPKSTRLRVGDALYFASDGLNFQSIIRHAYLCPNPMTTSPLPEQIELHRDRMWRRDEDLRVESAVDAERFIEDVGFANTLTDARRAGPSLYIAVCGRRDVSLPRNVQKNEETRLTWYLKDEVMRRGRVYYAKLAGGRSMFVAPRLISHFAAVWMPRRKDEPLVLSVPARRILKVLRREHDLATGDLRAESGITERAAFTRALDELQRQMKVIPQDVIYQPFSYIWTLAEDRFPEELRKPIRRKTALREIARAYLAGAGMSILGETARASGLSRVEAGLGNHQLVDEGYAIRLRQGIYALASLKHG